MQLKARGIYYSADACGEAGEATPESSLMVEIDAASPRRAILFMGPRSPVIYGKKTVASDGAGGTTDVIGRFSRVMPRPEMEL